MIEHKPEQKTKSSAGRLPGIGRASQLVLIIGVLAIIFIGLYVINRQQAPQQAELKQNIAMLQRRVSAGTQIETREKLQARIRQAEAETEVAQAVIPASDQLTEIMDSFIKLAKNYDIEITSTSVAISSEAAAVYDIYIFTLCK